MVIAWDENGVVMGMGAFKLYAIGVVEIKRMYTQPADRGRGVAQQMLAELGRWACEEHHHAAILETGHKQIAAIALYQKVGYRVIPNFEPYAGII